LRIGALDYWRHGLIHLRAFGTSTAMEKKWDCQLAFVIALSAKHSALCRLGAGQSVVPGTLHFPLLSTPV